MATLKQTVNDVHDWSLSRIYELCSRDDFEEVVNGDSLRQEFDEWINSYNKMLMKKLFLSHILVMGASMIYNFS